VVFQEEHQSFRDIADRMIEDKEREIAKLLKENRDLHQSLDFRPAVSCVSLKSLIATFVTYREAAVEEPYRNRVDVQMWSKHLGPVWML